MSAEPASSPENAQAFALALEKLRNSEAFKGSGRALGLLGFLVERTLAGDPLKEFTVGAEGLGRGAKFDPRFDSIVRVEVSRLRSRLAMYYATEGAGDAVRIIVPKGTYVPRIERHEAPRPSRKRWMAAAAAGSAALVVAAAVAWLAAQRDAPAAPAAAMRFDVDLGSTVALRSTQVGGSSIVISPDGRRLAFVSFREQTPLLVTKRLDSLREDAPRELAGTAGARGPFFSPNGEWLGFAANGALWKTRVDGSEPPVRLCDAEELLGASWGDDGFIVAALSTAGLVRIPSAGGAPQPIGGIAPGARWPQVLPGSHAILYTAGLPGPTRVEIHSLESGVSRPLVNGGAYARFLSSGHLAWVDQADLVVAPFDAQRLELSGIAQTVVSGVEVGMYGSAEFDVAQTGTLVYRRNPRGGQSIVNWLEESGEGARTTRILSEPADYFGLRLSPDATRLAYRIGSPDQNAEPGVRVVDARSGQLLNIVGSVSSAPVWTADGRFIVGTARSGEVRWAAADGSEASGTVLAADGAIRIPWSIDAAGQRLAFYQRGGSDGAATFDLWTAPITVTDAGVVAGPPEPLVVSDVFEVYPALSPDGGWVAYTSLETGAYEIYVRRVTGPANTLRVSDKGGIAAVWSRDGRKLFYQSAQQLMAVDLEFVADAVRASSPRPWGDALLAEHGLAPSFDVAADGRIVALASPANAPEQPSAANATVVVDLFSELERRRPQ
jgi:serine/threonine-protein kinase